MDFNRSFKFPFRKGSHNLIGLKFNSEIVKKVGPYCLLPTSIENLRRWPSSSGPRASSRRGKETVLPRNYYNTSLVSASRQESRVYSVIIIDRLETILKWLGGPLSMFTRVRPKNHEITDNRRKRPPCGNDAPSTITPSAIITPFPPLFPSPYNSIYARMFTSCLSLTF